MKFTLNNQIARQPWNFRQKSKMRFRNVIFLSLSLFFSLKKNETILVSHTSAVYVPNYSSNQTSRNKKKEKKIERHG